VLVQILERDLALGDFDDLARMPWRGVFFSVDPGMNRRLTDTNNGCEIPLRQIFPNDVFLDRHEQYDNHRLTMCVNYRFLYSKI